MGVELTTTTLVALIAALAVVAILAITYFTTSQESSSLWTYSRGALLSLFGVGT